MSLSLAERCRRFMGQCTACRDYREIIEDFKKLAHKQLERIKELESQIKKEPESKGENK